MKNKNIGHNMPPKTLNDFYLLDKDGERTGRIKLTNTICKKYLVRKYDAAIDDYTSVTVSDSEKIGLKARANKGGSTSFHYQYSPTGKNALGRRLNPLFYHLGYFPEMTVDIARSLVDDLKHAIKLGQDPKSVLEERRKAKKLLEVVAQWKMKVLHKAARFKGKTIKDTENRLKVWIDLESFNPRTNKIIDV